MDKNSIDKIIRKYKKRKTVVRKKGSGRPKKLDQKAKKQI
jgi:transposase